MMQTIVLFKNEKIITKICAQAQSPTQTLGRWSLLIVVFPRHFIHLASLEFRAHNARSIQLSSENDQKLQSFRKIGASHLQIRSKEHLELFSWFYNIQGQAVIPSNYSSHQEIESENYSIQFRDCTHTYNINTKFNLLLNFLSKLI